MIWQRRRRKQTCSPPEKFFRSVALIRDDSVEATATWFALWDDNRNCFDFVTGKRGKDETFRDCLHRQVLESLDVTERDVLVSNMAQLNLEFVDRLPESDQVLHVGVAFYMVHLYTRTAREAAEEKRLARWLTSAEVLDGKTIDGLVVSPNLSYLVRRADVIQSF